MVEHPTADRNVPVSNPGASYVVGQVSKFASLQITALYSWMMDQLKSCLGEEDCWESMELLEQEMQQNFKS